MIQVQIASQLTADGVDGIRWVLVEPIDAPQAPAPTPAATPGAAANPTAATPSEQALPSGRRLNLLKGLVIVLGLVAALALARYQFGAPTVRWSTPTPSPRLQPPPRPVGGQPALPAPPPAQPASGAALTARVTTA